MILFKFMKRIFIIQQELQAFKKKKKDNKRKFRKAMQGSGRAK